MPSCEREATDPTDPAPVCETHLAAVSSDTNDGDRDDDTGEEDVETPVPGPDPEFGAWDDADFSTTTPGTYPPFDVEQWMGRAEKQPFSPWADRDHPEADAGDDARFKWGLAENYTDAETVAMAEDDPRLDGRVFIQREDDPYGFVDGDKVRDPETGDVHPAFVAILEHLGATYADISTSGTGVHADYRGDLPIDGKGQATFEIDTEPWGSNDDVPTVEIYANTRVNVTTGDHVEGTPLEVREWDDDALRAILQANGYQDKPDVSHDTDRERPDLEGYDPQTSAADETANDVRDVLHAVDRLRPRDVPLSSRQTGSDSTGWETWDPAYRSSAGGESVHRPQGESVFYDHKEGEAFGLLGLFAAEQGIITEPWDRLAGADWWDAVDAAREQGAPIPEFDSQTNDVEPVAALPDTPDLETAATGWDWRTAAGRDHAGDDPLQDARDRASEKIASAVGSGDRVLIEALPTLGKSYGAVKAAAETDNPVTILTTRGNKEQYAQLEEWCAERGLTYKRLPAFTRHCETARGDHGEEWRQTVMDWYNRGATPKQIHALAEQEHGSGLPCQHDGECALAAAWDFDPEEHPDTGKPWDVLIGHYTHAHKAKVTQGRTVMFDEFPEDAFEQRLDHGIEGAISYFLQQHDPIPFEDYTDLLENRADESRRADALAFLTEYGTDADPHAVIASEAGHAGAPAAVLTILGGDDLGNGWERAHFPDDDRIGLFDRETGAVSILRPPELDYVSAVIALDGTPTKELWELTLGERLNHTQVLADVEREEYLTDALNLNLVRTTEAIKPYNNPDHVATDRDGALLEAIAEQHGTDPGLITSRRALDVYQDDGLLEYDPESGDVIDGPADRVAWFGNVLGSNRSDGTRVGAVIGSNHYGDRYIEKWGAYAGEVVERGEGKGADLTYGRFGDKVLRHMREHDTLQAAMRFGRDGNGAVVYVHTDTLPEWVPLAGEGRVLSTWSKGTRQVIDVANDLEEWTTAEIAAHPDVAIGERQVRNVLSQLVERGAVDREADGCGFVWRDTGLHRLNDHGDVELDPVDVDDLTDEESAEVARSSNYTWNFRTSRRSAGESGPGASKPPDSLGTRGAIGADRDGPPPG